MRALLLLAFAFALMGQRDPILVPEVSQHEVQVRQGFTGTELLLFGAVVGAQFGSRAGALLRGEQLRGLLALLVLAVCVKIGYDLAVRPEDLLSVELVR